MIDRVVHYTSNEKFEKIKGTGFLKPLSPFSHLNSVSYLVGIPEGEEEGWESVGLLGYLKKYTKMEVRLVVPIELNSEGFVLDHALLSPKRSLDLFAMDVWKERQEKLELRLEDLHKFNSLMDNYFNSRIPIKEYLLGRYKAPEVWLNQTTPLEKIEVMKLSQAI